MAKTNPKGQILRLRGKAAVFVDWANVYNWKDSLKSPVDPEKLLKYLKTYPQISSFNFYFGTDRNKKSRKFLKKMSEIGWRVVTKPVKHIVLGKIGDQVIKKRKCDFDIEICMDVYALLEKGFESFIFFTGDGDFAPLYRHLISLKKQVIVIFEKGFVGREIWEIKRGLFKTRLSYLWPKNNPRSKTDFGGARLSKV
jgi:uncharacterized LabA/DUF88 family protein